MNDPYSTWLNVAEKHRPLNHYQLLGLPVFENSAPIIEAAASQQAEKLQAHTTGPQTKLARRVLFEIESARQCLLDAEMKARYDDQLRQKFGSPTSSSTSPLLSASQPSVSSPAQELDEFGLLPLPEDKPSRPTPMQPVKQNLDKPHSVVQPKLTPSSPTKTPQAKGQDDFFSAELDDIPLSPGSDPLGAPVPRSNKTKKRKTSSKQQTEGWLGEGSNTLFLLIGMGGAVFLLLVGIAWMLTGSNKPLVVPPRDPVLAQAPPNGKSTSSKTKNSSIPGKKMTLAEAQRLAEEKQMQEDVKRFNEEQKLEEEKEQKRMAEEDRLMQEEFRRFEAEQAKANAELEKVLKAEEEAFARETERMNAEMLRENPQAGGQDPNDPAIPPANPNAPTVAQMPSAAFRPKPKPALVDYGPLGVFPDSLLLPELEGGRLEQSMEIVKCNLPQAAEVKLELWSEIPQHEPKFIYSLQPAAENKLTWEVLAQRRPPKGTKSGLAPDDQKTIPIAHFQLSTSELQFQWLPGSLLAEGNELRNLVLSLKLATHHRTVALRSPIRTEPVPFDQERDLFTVALPRDAHLPDRRSLSLEILAVSGFPADLTVSPPTALVAHRQPLRLASRQGEISLEFQTRLEGLGNDCVARWLALAVDPNGFSAPLNRPDLETMTRTLPFDTEKAERTLANLQVQASGLQSQLRSVAAQPAENTLQQGIKNHNLASLNKTLSRIQQAQLSAGKRLARLKGLAQALPSLQQGYLRMKNGVVQYRVFYICQGREVDVFITGTN